MAFDKKAYDKEYRNDPINKARAKELRDRPEAKARAKELYDKRPRYEPDRNVLEKKCIGNKYHKCDRTLNTFKENGDLDWFRIQKESADGLRNECRYCNFVYVINNSYGLTLRQLKNMIVEQGNKCAHKHCKVEFTINEYGIPTCFHIDHNHKTGFIRGLLCPKHNTQLSAVENPKEYEGHKEYLEEAKRKEELENLKKHNRKNNNIFAFKEGENEQKNN